jgi:hypothetical protein
VSRLRFLAAIGAALLLGAAPSRADWQFTRWGMSADDAVAASRGSLRRVPFDQKYSRADLACVVRGNYSVDRDSFEAWLCFDAASKLQLVALEKESCSPNLFDRYRAALAARYGTGTGDQRSQYSERITWTDVPGNNSIGLSRFPLTELCIIVYRPGVTGLSRGL